MKIFKELEKIGYKHRYKGTIEELDKMKINNPNLHAELMHVIIWLEKKYNVWITVSYDYNYKTYKLYHAFTKSIILGNSIYPRKSVKNPIEIYKLAICELLDIFIYSPHMIEDYQNYADKIF
jgi:hypothetical protein